MPAVGIINLYSFTNSRKTGYQGDLSSEMAAIHLIIMPTFPYKLLHFGHSFFHFDIISSTVLNSTPVYKLAPLAVSSGCRESNCTDSQPGLHVKDISTLCKDAPCCDISANSNINFFPELET